MTTFDKNLTEALNDLEQEAILEKLEALIKSAQAVADRDLKGYVVDVEEFTRLTLAGMTAKHSLIYDQEWWKRMYKQWKHIDDDKIMKLHQSIISELSDQIKTAVETGITVESKGMIFGFFKLLMLIAKVMTSFISQTDTNTRNGHTGYKNDKFNKRNKVNFELRKFNPFIVNKFVMGCKTITDNMINSKEFEKYPDEVEDNSIPDEVAVKPSKPRAKSKPILKGNEISTDNYNFYTKDDIINKVDTV